MLLIRTQFTVLVNAKINASMRMLSGFQPIVSRLYQPIVLDAAHASLLPIVLVAGLMSGQTVVAAEQDNDGWTVITSTNNSEPAVVNEDIAAEQGLSTQTQPTAATPLELDAPLQQLTVRNKESTRAKAIPVGFGLRERVYALEPSLVAAEPARPLIREIESEPDNTSTVPREVIINDVQPPVPTTITDVQPSDTGSAFVQPISNLDMFVGELRVLGKVDVTRVAIGNGDIIRAEVLKTGELLVIGQTAGSTSLRLWNKDDTQTAYNIRVGESDPETRVRMERMVRMRVRMVEFRKRALSSLGIDWSDGTTGPAFAVAGDAIGNNLFRPVTEGFDGLPNQVAPFSTFFGIASNITSQINLLAQTGDAITLAEPVLSAVNGGQASFLAGGEVPYPSIGSNGQTTVEFKEYGVRLQVAPIIDNGGNVRAFVETEISQLDSAVSVNDAPGLLTRRSQTEVNVRSGETIVISGLLSSESANDVQSVPGLGRLPIIGRFFSSTNKTDDVRELVIFVTPEVIEPSGQLMSQTNQATYERSTQRLEKLRDSLPLME